MALAMSLMITILKHNNFFESLDYFLFNQRAKNFDDNGKKLFEPTLPASSRRMVEKTPSSVGVNDFLYRAAVVSE